MTSVEQIQPLVDAINASNKAIKEMLVEPNEATIEDIQLSSNLLDYGVSLNSALYNSEYIPAMRVTVAKEALARMLQAIRKHSEYRNILALEVSQDYVALSDGEIVLKTEQPTGKMLTLDQLKAIIEK